MPQRHGAVTLEMVAERAGVSLKSASNAVNGTGRMADETRERILGVVDELGYRVNLAARSLNRGRTGTVTLAVPTLKGAYLGELAEAVITAARDLDLVVYVTTYIEGGELSSRRLLQQFDPRASDGLLLSLAENEDLEPADFDVSFPLVCLGSRSTFGRTDRVSASDVRDARTAAAYLYDHGATSLAVVGARTAFDADAIAAATEGNAQLRLRGVLEAARATDRMLDPRLVGVTGEDWTIGSGSRATRAVIAAGVPFDALVCLNDGLAIGAISALHEAGLRVPDDVQVIGFDSLEESAYLAPPLTSMASQVEWIARTALERLVKRIDGHPDAPEQLRAETLLVQRSTTR